MCLWFNTPESDNESNKGLWRTRLHTEEVIQSFDSSVLDQGHIKVAGHWLSISGFDGPCSRLYVWVKILYVMLNSI